MTTKITMKIGNKKIHDMKSSYNMQKINVFELEEFEKFNNTEHRGIQK